jgi:hypothetical protein
MIKVARIALMRILVFQRVSLILGWNLNFKMNLNFLSASKIRSKLRSLQAIVVLIQFKVRKIY